MSQSHAVKTQPDSALPASTPLPRHYLLLDRALMATLVFLAICLALMTGLALRSVLSDVYAALFRLPARARLVGISDEHGTLWMKINGKTFSAPVSLVGHKELRPGDWVDCRYNPHDFRDVSLRHVSLGSSLRDLAAIAGYGGCLILGWRQRKKLRKKLALGSRL